LAAPGKDLAGRAYVHEPRCRAVQQVKHVVKVVADLAEQFAASSTGFDGIAVNRDAIENDEVPASPVRELKRVRPAPGSEDRPVFPSKVVGGELAGGCRADIRKGTGRAGCGINQVDKISAGCFANSIAESQRECAIAECNSPLRIDEAYRLLDRLAQALEFGRRTGS